MQSTQMTLSAVAFVLSGGFFATEVVAAPDSAQSDQPLSADCASYSKKPDADVGDIIRAGCKPTLAQMSALMNNPVGKVALWWN